MSAPSTKRTAANVSATRYSATRDRLLRSSHHTKILLAIANDDVTDAAIGVTAALAEARKALPTVLHVVDPTPYAPPPLIPTMMRMAEALIGPEASEERRRDIMARVERVTGKRMPWPAVSRLGAPTACIADEAHARHSELIVLGLHHHGKVDALLGAETTVHVLTDGGVPVLGVTRSLHGLPRRVLVGVDFSRASMSLARLAARLIEPPGELVLAHVMYPGPVTVPEELEGGVAIEHEGIHSLLERLKADVVVPKGVFVKTVRLTGVPEETLVTYAEHMQPDLIAVASQRHTRTRRLLLGTVTRHLIRDGRWSMLVTPAM